MKTLANKQLEWGKEPRLTNLALDRGTNEYTINNFVFSNADCYFWGKFEGNPSQRGFLPVTVYLNLDYPSDADVNPTWDTLIVGYNDLNLQKPDALLAANLTQVNRETGEIMVLATFDSNSHIAAKRAEGCVRFNANFDFHHNSYFVKLELVRTRVGDMSVITYRVGLAHGG